MSCKRYRLQPKNATTTSLVDKVTSIFERVIWYVIGNLFHSLGKRAREIFDFCNGVITYAHEKSL